MIFKGFGEDGIRVVVVEDQDVLISLARGHGESSGLVGVDSSGVSDAGKKEVCFWVGFVVLVDGGGDCFG